MRSIEKSAKTVDDAISAALEELNLTLSEVKVEILENGSRGVMGIGSTDAIVRVTEKVKTGWGDKSKNVLTELLQKMDMRTDITIQEEDNMVRLVIGNTPLGGILIGYRGETLNALQYLVYQILNKDNEFPGEIEIDVQDYRKRRQRMLKRMVEEGIDKIRSTGKPLPLEPMNAYDRKYIHLLVKEDPEVTSMSEGEGTNRHVILSPRTEEYSEENESESTEIPIE